MLGGWGERKREVRERARYAICRIRRNKKMAGGGRSRKNKMEKKKLKQAGRIYRNEKSGQKGVCPKWHLP